MQWNLGFCKQEVLGVDAVQCFSLVTVSVLTWFYLFYILTFSAKRVLKETKTFTSKSAVRNDPLLLLVTAAVLQHAAISKHSYLSSAVKGGEEEFARFVCQKSI